MSQVGWEAMCLALNDLEHELRLLDLWSAQAPSRAQLASTEPFCVNTMAFEQWLQWVFIPRMRALAEQRAPLPGDCQIRPMGDQALLHLGRRGGDLLNALAWIDQLAIKLS